MELTPVQAQEMLMGRLKEHPEVAEVFYAPSFKKGLEDILDFEEISQDLLPLVEQEVLIVLAFYAPISELGENIAKTLSIDADKGNRIANLIESLLLSPLYDILIAFENAWYAQLKKEKGTPEYLEYVLRTGKTGEIGSFKKEQLIKVAPQISVALLAEILKEGSIPPLDQKELRRELEIRGTEVQKDWLHYTPTGNIFGK